MKKYLLIFSAILLCGSSVKVNAQDYYETKHDLAVSTGLFTNSQIFGFLTDVTTAIFTGGTIRTDNEHDYLPISLEYYYHVSKLVSVGAIGCYNHRDANVIGSDGTKYGKDKHNFYTIMPSAKFDWLRNKHFGMYSKVGVGATFIHECAESSDKTEDDVVVSWQASLLGAEFGGEGFRGFVELGCGEQGVFVAGVRCKF